MATNRSNLTLQDVLNDFSREQGVMPIQVQNLEQAIAQTPALQEAMRRAVELQELQQLDFLSDANSAGSYNNKTLRISESDLHFSADPKEHEKDKLELISTLAHETQHALNSSRSKQTWQTFREEITALAQSGQPVIDYTRPLQKLQQMEIWDEATAEIAAWNAVVSHLQHKNPQQPVTLQDIYAKYLRAAGFVNESAPDANNNRTYTMNPGFVLNADMTLDASNPANIQAMRQYYFDPSFSMGECGNADYRNLYARRALWDVQQKHMQHAPDAQMMLDMPALGLSERLLEENGMPVPTSSGQMPYVDRQTPQVARVFDHTYELANATPQQANPQAFQYIDNGNVDPYPLPVQACQRPAGGTQTEGTTPRVLFDAPVAAGGLSFFDRLVQAAQGGDPQALQPAAQNYIQTQEAQDWLKQGQQQLQQDQAAQQQQLQAPEVVQASGPVMRM